MIRAIFYIHQNSGAYAGVYTCDRTYQMKRTAIESQKERNALTCFNEKVQINNVKMGAFSLHTCQLVPTLAIVTNTNLTNL